MRGDDFSSHLHKVISGHLIYIRRAYNTPNHRTHRHRTFTRQFDIVYVIRST